MTVEPDTGPPPPSRVELSSAARHVAVVALIGEHDLAGCETVRTALARAAIRAPHVLVDLTACDFIDSTVISMLLHTETVVTRDGGRLVVALPGEHSSVTRMAELIKLAQRIPTYASVDAALSSLEPDRSAVTLS
jgi:anti-anti-sigma factor